MKNYVCAILFAIGIMMLTVGCEGSYVYVDQDNTTGPWDGTEAHPYRTIQDGLDAASSGSTVLVEGGYYSENITIKREVDLRPKQAEAVVLIDGEGHSPTILAKGDNRISGLIVSGGTVGVQFDLEEALRKQTTKTIRNTVSDCEIRQVHRGVELITPTNLAFDTDRKSIYMHIIHNFIHRLSGDGIHLTLNGPATGELQISLDIVDNVIQETFTGVTVNAKGQGPNPDGFVRALYAGWISNNLIFGGQNGIVLHSENLGSTSPAIAYNTLANNVSHGITASAEEGQDGGASTHPSVICNIIAGNRGYGYQEFSERTSVSTLSHNLFYQNLRGHYADTETESVINSQTGLNTPIVDNKVVFFGGSGNLVADPLFVEGAFPWRNGLNFEGAHAFFLQQDGTLQSPAVDSGDRTAADAELDGFTTRTDAVPDTGDVDIGFHYRKP